jgi:peptidoglycan hydrolase CwlO-like protein
MKFDYGHTCPGIDENIDHVKEAIYQCIDSVLDDASPLFDGEKKCDFIEQYQESLYKDIEHYFEDVRKSNEDMRKEADKQLDQASDEIEDLKQEVGYLKENIKALEDQIPV